MIDAPLKKEESFFIGLNLVSGVVFRNLQRSKIRYCVLVFCVPPLGGVFDEEGRALQPRQPIK